MAMSLSYSPALEELAYSKDAQALKELADFAVAPPSASGLVRREESFFEAGEKLGDGTPVLWITWWKDGGTALFFRGDFKAVRRKFRRLPDRSDAETKKAL